jgi:hypothetical protein
VSAVRFRGNKLPMCLSVGNGGYVDGFRISPVRDMWTGSVYYNVSQSIECIE